MGFLSKKKTIKNFRYYISEIIILVIGVFMAIQLNNLNENSKNSKEEQKALIRILADLKTDKLIIERNKASMNKGNNYLKKIIFDSSTENLDSLYMYLASPFNHYPMNSEYINLKYSGKLGLITNDTIRYNLVRYYELYYDLYSNLSEEHKNFSKEDVSEYFDREFPSDTTFLVDSKIAKNKLKDIKLQKLIMNQIVYQKNISQNLRPDIIDIIIKKIEKNIQK